MAHPIDAHKTSSPQPQHSKGEVSTISSKSLPILRKNHDHDDHGNRHIKKSVFMRVKEKARKLKKSISIRKHRDDNGSRSPYMTPPGSAGPVDDDRDRPEFFSSPLYVPTAEPQLDKNAPKEHPRETNDGSLLKPKDTSNPNGGSVDSIDSKLSGLAISSDRDANEPEPKENTMSSMQPQDKGVSVKEYLLHKLEPGEDERALSQAITQTISPRRDKMKEAMNTLLGTEEPSQSTSKASNSEVGGSNLSPNKGSGSLVESSDAKTGSSANSPNSSHDVEPKESLSEASNTNVCSPSTSAQSQSPGQKVGSPSTGGSNLKPDSGSNQNDSNASGSSSSSPTVRVDTSANATQAPTSTSSHEGNIF
ncbi:hypothetical protein OSB04_023506 [Centaurea solstitialis]|uniref:LTI65/LTI78 PGEED repeat domain-containing protein n=1 Tax=Centaurea solstitialis TaxID=347529 RepID=A0AA38WB54_9ASTR|nr:hypothetical protein OSB04_023506 [Centaurea solstitialis]